MASLPSAISCFDWSLMQARAGVATSASAAPAHTKPLESDMPSSLAPVDAHDHDRGVVLVDVAAGLHGREQRIGDGLGSAGNSLVHDAQDVRLAERMDAVAGENHDVAGLQREGP